MSVAQTLFAALQNPELKEFMSIFGYETQLEDLQRTVSTIKAVFQDVERKQTLSAVEQQLIEDLKDAVFEADDLLDEFVTLVEQKKLLRAGGGVSKKMHLFLSRLNPLGVAYKMSKGVKKIKKKLDDIAYNKQFSFDYDPEPIRKRRPQTCSYVDAGEIIGREDDLEKIIGMLLDTNVERDVSFLSIVGIGGLGKTALAQLVYNDPRITIAFQTRKWTCVSDEDQKELDVKEILSKIIGRNCEGCSIDKVQNQLREQLANKRNLVVLDDVWTENCYQWRQLEKYLIGGKKGSWIMVTTRSWRTASIIQGGLSYELQGLSNEKSWRLFKRTAFISDTSNPPKDLVKIGKDIVDQCARIPLAIRVVGSLLYGQDKKKWQSVHAIGLASIRDSENDIMPLLKLSYHHLQSPLKSCFTYCALFPKDFRICKEMLISLWIAQGYIVPLDIGQSIEEAGEEYFLILLRRCFFQDIRKDEVTSEIYSVKIHDLMHDIAQSVSRKEIYATGNINGNLDKKVRHLSIGNTREYGSFLSGKNHLRSYIHANSNIYTLSKVDHFSVETLIATCRHLRALDLSRLRMQSLPDSIGTLLHVRYLDFSDNIELELLPKPITQLCNLQTLKLISCNKLIELPKDFDKLVKLRVLDISNCSKLNYMPRGMNKLTNLYKLSDFIVANKQYCSSWEQWVNGLEDLKALNNLKGRLDIHIRWPKNAKNVARGAIRKKGLYLSSKEHLTRITIDFKDEEDDERMNDEEIIALMEDLHPHPHLKTLEIEGYYATRMPDWGSFLPNLVELSLRSCKELAYLTNFGSAKEVSFLPSLETLHLDDMPKLKGWRRGIVGVRDYHLLQLRSLRIVNCPELTWIPLCPKLETLVLYNFNRRLLCGEFGPATTMASCKEVGNPFPKLREVKTNDVTWLKSLPMCGFQCVERLQLQMLYSEEVENLAEVREVFRSCSSSLRFLDIWKSPKLRSGVGGGLEYLTALEELQLWGFQNLRLSEEKEGEDSIMPCPSLLPSLCTLKLSFSLLENLPNWMQFLPALRTLRIHNCTKLKAMPNWMPKLTSLRHLYILFCSKRLERRCQKDPPGEDWPYIQHIPTIEFEDCS